MKEIVKELLVEMIGYEHRIQLPHKHLLKAFNEMEAESFVFSIRNILQWLKEVALGWENTDKFEMHPLHEKRYKNLLALSPTLNELFALEDGHIIWNAGVTKEEKIEILDYVNENHKIVTRIRMRKRD